MSGADDLLGRKPFAEALADAILAQKGTQPLVIGLLGPWGSGKSSILRMTCESLEEQVKTIDKSKRPVLTHFNPWMVADQGALVTQFFDEMIEALGKVNYGKGLKKAARLIRSYSDVLGFVGVAPAATAKAVGIAGKIGQGIAKGITWVLSQADSPQAQKAKIDGALLKLTHKVVIVIDDIDRLTASEVRQLFQVIKSLASFPNTIYVIAFDNEMVELQLGESQAARAEAFVEKIVQVPFHVPPIPIETVHKYIQDSVLLMFQKWGDKAFERRHFRYLFHYGIKRLVTNLREAKRYQNVLLFNANVCRGRIAASDLMGMTALQVFAPKVLSAVHENKALFIAPTSPKHLHAELLQQDAISSLNSIVNRQHARLEEPLVSLLRLLFPKVNAIASSSGGPIEFELRPEWRIAGKICDPASFDLFFTLSLPSGEYYSEEIDTIVQSNPSRNGLAAQIRLIASEGRIKAFLEGLQRNLATMAISPETAKTIVEALIDAGDEIATVALKDEQETMAIEIHQLLEDTILAAANHVRQAEARLRMVKEAIATTTTSIWIPVLITQRALNDQEDVKPMMREKIGKWMSEGRLLRHSHIGVLVNFWEAYGATKQQLAPAVEAIVNDDEALLNVLRDYAPETSLRGEMGYYSPPTHRVNVEALANHINTAKAYERLKTMLHSKKLADRDQRLVQATLEQLAAYKTP